MLLSPRNHPDIERSHHVHNNLKRLRCGEAVQRRLRPGQGADDPRRPHRRRHHARLHCGKRLPRSQGRADLRHLDPGRCHLHGDPAPLLRSHDPGEQHRPDDRLGGRDAVRHHLRAARTHHRGLVDRLPLSPDGSRHHPGRHPRRHLLDPAAARARDQLRPALPRGCGRRRGPARGRHQRGRRGVQPRAGRHRARLHRLRRPLLPQRAQGHQRRHLRGLPGRCRCHHDGHLPVLGPGRRGAPGRHRRRHRHDRRPAHLLRRAASGAYLGRCRGRSGPRGLREHHLRQRGAHRGRRSHRHRRHLDLPEDPRSHRLRHPRFPGIQCQARRR